MSSQVGNTTSPLFSFSCTMAIVSLADKFVNGFPNGKISLRSGAQKFGSFGEVTSSLKVVKGFWKAER